MFYCTAVIRNLRERILVRSEGPVTVNGSGFNLIHGYAREFLVLLHFPKYAVEKLELRD